MLVSPETEIGSLQRRINQTSAKLAESRRRSKQLDELADDIADMLDTPAADAIEATIRDGLTENGKRVMDALM